MHATQNTKASSYVENSQSFKKTFDIGYKMKLEGDNMAVNG
jgi:hypothetical protein